MKNKLINLSLYYFLVLLFLELVFRIFNVSYFFSISLINMIIYLIPISIFLGLISRIFNNRINKIIVNIIIIIMVVWFATHFVFKTIFDVYFSVSTLSLADQATDFIGTTLSQILQNIFGFLLMVSPIITTILLRNKLNFKKQSWKALIIKIVLVIISYGMFLGSLYISNNKAYSAYELYHNVNDNTLNMEKLGIVLSTNLEVKRMIFGFDENLDLDFDSGEKKVVVEEVKYNVLDIDFDSLINSTTNSKIKSMHEYFNNDTGTKQNAYTGYFKGKNLIVFMAESFNSIGVSEELTPTLYKLTHSGFVFDNFYSPVILSTLGGEFQELTSLFPSGNMLSIWRKNEFYYPMGLGYVFSDLNYVTHAYHNGIYSFQSRNKYLEKIGFTNFIGCRNGLEKVINCNKWPQSDVEMIEGTTADYINSVSPFMTYYVTISGHLEYNWWNSMANKHKSEVSNLDVSEKAKAYIATQIELNNSLELLINKLTEAGKLQDTVIALVGDHYPYGLSLSEVNELSDYERDGVIELNRSNFILWNSEMPTINVTKVGSQLDVMPTLYNLFGIEYDSRLVIGKDILSDEPGIAIMANRSWVTDYGRYYSGSSKFVPKEGVEVCDDYVSNINKEVSNKLNMSKLIMDNNYYDIVLGD